MPTPDALDGFSNDDLDVALFSNGTYRVTLDSDELVGSELGAVEMVLIRHGNETVVGTVPSGSPAGEPLVIEADLSESAVPPERDYRWIVRKTDGQPVFSTLTTIYITDFSADPKTTLNVQDVAVTFEQIQSEPVITSDPPTSVSATLNGDGHPEITWTNPTDALSDQIQIERRRTTNGATTYGVVYLEDLSEGETFVDDASLITATYEYRLRSVASDGTLSTAETVVVDVTDVTDPEPPTSPLLQLTTDNEPRLTWTKSVSSDTVGYRIYRALEGASLSVIASDAGDVDEYVDSSSLDPDETYEYAVSALDGEGNESTLTPTVKISPNDTTDPDAANDLSAANYEPSPGSPGVRLTWTDPAGEATVDVLRDGSPVQTGLADGTELYEDTAVSEYVEYTYQLRFEKTNGLTALSNEVFIRTEDLTDPTPPTGLSGTPGATSVSLSWVASTDDESGMSEYLIARGTSPAPTAIIGSTTHPSTSFVDDNDGDGLTQDQDYYYRIRGVDNSGRQGPWSSGIRVTPGVDNAPTVSITSSAISIDHNGTATLVYDASDDLNDLATNVAEIVLADGTTLAPDTGPTLTAGTQQNGTFEADFINIPYDAQEFRVTVSDQPLGQEGVDTQAMTVRPDPPADLSQSPSAPNEIDLTWNPPNDSSYVEEYELTFIDNNDGTGDKVVTASSTQLLGEAIEYDTNYTIEVRTVDQDGDKSVADSITFDTLVSLPLTQLTISSNIDGASSTEAYIAPDGTANVSVSGSPFDPGEYDRFKIMDVAKTVTFITLDSGTGVASSFAVDLADGEELELIAVGERDADNNSVDSFNTPKFIVDVTAPTLSSAEVSAPEDDLVTTFSEPVTGPTDPTTAFALTGGYVFEQENASADNLAVCEAENATAIIAGTTHNWEVLSDLAGAVGDYVAANPNDGTNYTAGDADAPILRFVIDFKETGAHDLWLRVAHSGGGSSDDSIFRRFDGGSWVQANSLSDGGGSGVMSSLSADTFQWCDEAQESSGGSFITMTINVPSTGPKVLEFHMREDGLKFDRLVLTTNSSYDPSSVNGGDGPPESTKSAAISVTAREGGDGTDEHTYSMGRTVYQGEDVLLDYTQGDAEDDAENLLADITDFTVTNNSTL